MRDVLVLAKAALKDAVFLGLIPSSPAEFVTCPKPPTDEPNYLPQEEIEKLLKNLKSESAKSPSASIDATRLALSTGMREGEICALRWQDLDLKAHIIRVRKAIGRESDNGEYLKSPKTKSSRRDIPISDGMVEMLAARKKIVVAAAQKMGTIFSPNWFVFGTFDQFMSPKALARNFKRRIQRLNLHGSQDKPVTFHCLRHTYATVAVRSGADIKSISSILGHTDASVTLNMYAAADPKAKKETTKLVSPLLE